VLVKTKGQLTEIAGWAADSRRSGIAFQMARTLERIETRAREIRDGLYVPGEHARNSKEG
jgi:hypothetical protein